MTFDLYASTYQESANYYDIMYSFKSYIFIFLRTVCNNEDISSRQNSWAHCIYTHQYIVFHFQISSFSILILSYSYQHRMITHYKSINYVSKSQACFDFAAISYGYHPVVPAWLSPLANKVNYILQYVINSLKRSVRPPRIESGTFW